jgi:hypothetical protein
VSLFLGLVLALLMHFLLLSDYGYLTDLGLVCGFGSGVCLTYLVSGHMLWIWKRR